jgi:hypothetical protein
VSDSRWTDVDADLDDALRHFGMALQIFAAGGFEIPGVEGYKNSGAFMHGMAAGYTSVENALKRILDILGETPPSDDGWHKAIIDRVSRPMAGSNARPALFDDEMKRDLLECMRMRHRVRHAAYDEFIPTKAEPSVEAARHIVSRVREAIVQFKQKVDPEPGEAGGGAGGEAGPRRPAG